MNWTIYEGTDAPMHFEKRGTAWNTLMPLTRGDILGKLMTHVLAWNKQRGSMWPKMTPGMRADVAFAELKARLIVYQISSKEIWLLPHTRDDLAATAILLKAMAAGTGAVLSLTVNGYPCRVMRFDATTGRLVVRPAYASHQRWLCRGRVPSDVEFETLEKLGCVFA